MEKEILVQAITEAFKEVLPERMPTTCENCVCINNKEKHDKHHQFIDRAIIFMEKMEEVKWFSLKTIAATILLTFVGILFFVFFGVKLIR